eukprot:4352934-Amphidinium_carterae.1
MQELDRQQGALQQLGCSTRISFTHVESRSTCAPMLLHWVRSTLCQRSVGRMASRALGGSYISPSTHCQAQNVCRLIQRALQTLRTHNDNNIPRMI